MNWAREEASRIINAVGFRDAPADVIAAALQGVADECAELARERYQHFIDALSCKNPRNLELAHKSIAATDVLCAIRARFPREGA